MRGSLTDKSPLRGKSFGFEVGAVWVLYARFRIA
jgi:hypothetical protein